MSNFNAIVTQSDPGWSIYVPEVDRHTYAAHLREIEPIARDLVQVMTDLPEEDIHVHVQLPNELSDAIAAMHAARSDAAAAETTAREAQQAAATALRNAGAPLRDIAAALGVSHQRVHQVLEEADAARERQLELFRREVNFNLAEGALANVDLSVTNDEGETPVVVALVDELLSVMIERIQAAGGYANVFVQDRRNRKVLRFAVVREVCAIGEPDDTMVGDEAPGRNATIGMFLHYVQQHPNGVTISTALGHPACARDARPVELVSA
ncbi:Conserved protein of uncharacterised function; putative phage protein [Mycobacteroides abscessus subsp. bolletii]|uniref:hypothetical protein n=1 Tax=Mycobacteroides abscessus TaxID=36809 RepID=UPI000928FD8C|nr:hypothetical protein [Mycobacteroides abscessus]SIJ39137.1 Conserved protein of uncharacterised function; putative phage protein [Mycobacteroides abscessus subsp. bolletii]SLE27385.1 Conserved protein of uncharacterised function; putative phage protein [Mycobacteroides abscessus subsp. bolletii]SLF14668.1 Conserved protein of uncharacterised function; putative phage protein [Mycobacteroides abscessus subsp. bolletii]